MKKRTIYIGLFLIFIIGVISLIGTFAIDTTITEGNSSKADYLFNIVLGDRTNRDILIPSYDSKIVDIKISNPNEFNMSYLLYLEGVNSSISAINISDTDANGVLNSKNTNLIKVFIQNNSGTDITTSIKDIVGFEKEILELPSNSTSINKDAYYKAIVKSNNNTYGKVKPNIKLSTKNGTVKYNIVPNDGYQYKSTTCEGTIVDNILTISNITSNVNCEVVFEPKDITVSLDLAGGKVTTTYIGPNEYTYTVPYTGNYKIELWGAQGGGTSIGNGAYTSGNIDLSEKEKLYFYTGGMGSSNSTQANSGGYNGGGYSGNWEGCNSYGGGGSTDVRLSEGSWNDVSGLNTRIMVAAGGAGTGSCITTTAGHAGGLIGGDGTTNYSDYNTAAYLPKGSTQTETGFAYETTVRQGGFGYAIQSNTLGWGGGGGGGYYGGSNGHGTTGSGGSSYISGHTGCVAIASSSSTTPKSGCTTGTSDNSCSIHYSGKKFTDTVMIDGSGYAWTNTKGSLQQMPKLSGSYDSGIGNSGNGVARITLMSDANYNVTYNTKYGTLPTPTRTGYTFGGWYTGENGTGTRVDENTVLTNANNHTLYAYWIRNINVTYNYRNNIYNQDTSTWVFSGNNSHVDNNYSYNGTTGLSLASTDLWTGVVIPLNDDKKQNTNYILSVKAYRTVDFSGNLRAYTATHASDESVINWNYGIDINISLPINTWREYSYSFNSGAYAKWYNITINYDATNQGPVYVSDIRLDEYESKSIQRGEKYGTMPTPTRSGYTFGGWYTEPNGGGTRVTSDTIVSNASDHTLYAKWTIKVYTITFNKNGGTGGTDSTTITHGTKQGSYPDITLPTMSGYKFIGYYDAASGGTQYYNSTGQSVRDWDKTSDTTLYAHWEASARVPTFTYTGSSQIVDDNDNIISNPSTYIGNWKIRFLTSGTLTFSNSTGLGSGIDIFIVGGGGTGARGGEYIMQSRGGGGGGGGAAITVIKFPAATGNSYSIVIGGNQSNSSFGLSGTAYFTALAGGTPEAPSYTSSGGHVAPVGTGGAGRLSGQTSYYGASNVIVQTGGAGNGSAGNYEFNGSSGKRYGAGGSPGTGGVAQSSGGYSSTPGSGGADGGGKGGAGCSYVNQGRGYSTYGGYDGTAGTANTGSGGGGGGGYCGYSSTSTGTFGWGAAGGSGIVIIRNTR